jgi:hypothetical protein
LKVLLCLVPVVEGETLGTVGCAGFAKKIFSLQSETRSVLHGHVKNKIFLLLFTSNFSLLTKAKLIEHIFALFRFQNFFVSLHFTSDLFV